MIAIHPITPLKAVELVESAGIPDGRRVISDNAAAGLVKSYARVIETREVSGAKVRVLGAMAERRLPAPFEKVPTFKEQGVDLVLGTWRGLGAPLGTPPEVVKYLRDATRRTAEDPAFREALAKANLQPAYMEAKPSRPS